MTKEEYDKIKKWHIVTNIETGNDFIVEDINEKNITLQAISQFSMVIPKDDFIKNFELRMAFFIPSYNTINHMIELYKKWEEEKPNGVFINAYIKNNWNK